MGSSGASDELEAHLVTDKQSQHQPNEQFRLRYPTKSIWVVTCYAILLLLPWTLTIVINIRPIGGGSYFDQAGNFHPSQFDKNVQIISLINIVNALSAVVAIPVIDGVLLQAAVSFTQRKNSHQALNLCQTLALADQGWSNFSVWCRILWYRKIAISSRLLMYATTLVIIGGVSQPLQQYLVKPQTLQTITCLDVPGAVSASSCKKIPINAEISEVVTAAVPLIREPDLEEITTVWQTQVIQQMLGDLRVSNPSDALPQLWSESGSNTGMPEMIEDIYLPGNESYTNWWLSVPPNSTSTGVIRQHALRFNSTLTCNTLDQADLSLCPDGHLIHYNFQQNDASGTALTINLCILQDWDESPWQLVRSAQDIFESVYIDITTDTGVNVSTSASNCSSKTTMGYFELPNLKNGNRPQPLIREWPPDGLFNDCGYGACVWNDSLLPFSTQESSSPPNWAHTPSPGPLTLTFLTLFGNGSMMDALQQATFSSNDAAADFCKYYYPPLLNSSVDICAANTTLDMISSWLQPFQDLENVLYPSIILALKALLEQSARQIHDWDDQWSDTPGFGEGTGRILWYSPGHTTQKLTVTTGAIAVISALIFLQIAGLVVLLFYICTHPTWTTRLDAGAMFMLGGGFGQHLRTPSDTSEITITHLAQRDGFIGLPVEGESTDCGVRPTLGGLRPLSKRQ